MKKHSAVEEFSKLERTIGKPRKKHPVGRFLLKTALLLAAFWFVLPPFIVPAHGRVTSGFFIRSAPDQIILPDTEFHGGIDIAAPEGTPVKAAKSGFVTSAGSSPTAGTYIEISHWLGFSSRYLHLASRSVGEGRFVLKGARIGTMGATGRSTGSHLHFEVRWLGFRIPPGIVLAFDNLRRGLFSLLF